MSARPHDRRLAAWAVSLLALAGSACSSDFDPPSLLNRTRVLAIDADRNEAGPGESVTFQPRVFVPPGHAVVSIEWRFCPLTLGPTTGYRCALPACDLALAGEADGRLTTTPSQLLAQCAAAASADGGLPTGATVPETLESAYRLKVKTSDGDEEEVLHRFTLWTTRAPPERNRSPLVAAVTVAGAAPDAQGRFAPVVETPKPVTEIEIAVTVDAASLDRYTDALGNTFTEDPVVSYYATAGRFKQDRSSGVRGTVKWKLEKLAPTDTEASLYVVTRDLRGGQSLSGPYRIPITRAPPAP